MMHGNSNIKFQLSTYCPHSSCVCFLSTFIVSSYSINCFVAAMEEQFVLCEVWNKFYSHFGEFESQKRWTIFGYRSGHCSARMTKLNRPGAFREAVIFWAS